MDIRAATKIPNKKVLQAEASKAKLILVAAELFAERGYSGTTLEGISKRAGLTKGALYHHFRDKCELFEAAAAVSLHNEIQRISTESRLLTADTADDSWERLIAMIDLLLDGFLDPVVRRIVWVDGPSVLGWERWHEVVSVPTLDQINLIFDVFARQGIVKDPLRRPLAQLFFGSVQEAGMAIAHASDPEAKRAELAPALHWMLTELFGRTKGSSAGP